MIDSREARWLRKERVPGYDLIDLDEEAPVVVRGFPDQLVGSVPLHNNGDETAVLRTATLQEPDDRLGLEAGSIRRIGTTVLRPEQRHSAPLRLRLDPSTPPGEYHARVEVGGASRPLVINVTERVAIDLEPTSLVIDNRPGEPVTKSVTITNRGNLPVVIGDIGAVPLDDEQKECRILRRAAEALDTEDPVTVDRLVEAIARAAKRVLDESGLLRVRNLTGTTELAPGQTMRLDLQIDLPTTLDPHTRYRGLVPIVTRDLQFVVVPYRIGTAPETIPEKKTRTARAPRKPKPTTSRTTTTRTTTRRTA
ncbi:MAG TPA: hypothetical protein VHM94_04790 [Acidimicrobiia bacterium]|jgi:hypothetical protein|nr:hypothetical protein [Acidimicrobiia bacterium]